MKRAAIGLPLLLLSASVLAQTVGTGQIKYVVDGDTYWIQADSRSAFKSVASGIENETTLRPRSKQFKTRILNINTEESVHRKSDRNTSFGKSTSNIVKSELSGQHVTFKCEGHGIYNRPLCSIYLNDGTDYGLSLVRRGLSPYVTRYGRHRDNDRGYTKAELDAKRNKIGMWK